MDVQHRGIGLLQWRTLLHAVLALLVLICVVGLPYGRSTASAAEERLRLSVRPTVNYVQPGATLTYTIEVKNERKSSVDIVHLTLPYDRGKLTPAGSDLPKERDWISEITKEHVVVDFRSLSAGETRTANVSFTVAGGLPDNTVIELHPNYGWSGKNGSGQDDFTAHWVIVTRNTSSASATPTPVTTAGTPEVTVYPAAAPAGTAFQFYGNHYASAETVVATLTTQSGAQQPLNLRAIASPTGEVWLGMSSTGLAPGSYILTLRGTQSGQTGSVSFVVQ